jgi:hypothetical protein
MASCNPSEARVQENIKSGHDDNQHDHPGKKPDLFLVFGKTRFFPPGRNLMPYLAAITPIFLKDLH